MGHDVYCVKCDSDSAEVLCKTKSEVFELLKTKKAIKILNYSDIKTREAFVKAAKFADLDESEYEAAPYCVSTTISDVPAFVGSIDEWINEAMLDEFYYSDRLPFVEVYFG